MPRKSIPKALKNKVWDTYIGREKGVGECFCCKCEIDSKVFDCGHVVSVKNGGLNTLENMRPVCATCNKSMADGNMMKFKQEYFPKPEGLLEGIINTNLRMVKNYLVSKII